VLSPDEIASPLRRILDRARNVEVIMGEVTGFDLGGRRVRLADGSELPYDYLVVAVGARHAYFGHDEWEREAPGLKTVEDAVEIRRRILLAFELAEREAYLTGRHEPLNFAVIGGGPTGVEVAGAIADIARRALASDFKAIEEGRIKVGDEWIPVSASVWASGVAASPLGRELGAETDRAGRVSVAPDLSLPGRPEVFVIGDMASLKDASGKPVPGLGAAAAQEGKAAAANILRSLRGEGRLPFRYSDRGSMATIGRNRAVAEFGRWRLSGFAAWLLWMVVHVFLLIGFRNRLWVMREWVWAYFTRERSARLITGEMKPQAPAGARGGLDRGHRG
jgi:NADH dehydrogenase